MVVGGPYGEPAAPDLRAALLSQRVPRGTVPLEGIGELSIRGLSRGEVFAAQKVLTDPQAFEAKLLSLGLTDPLMTVEDVREWQANAPAGQLERVVEAIKDLSGLGEGADKSGVPGV